MMHLSRALAAVAVAAPLVASHDGSAIPKIVGVNMRDLKARNVLASMYDRAKSTAAGDYEARRNLESRQNTDGQCGPGFGSCAAGYCCSQDGWCGKGANYCYSPGCYYAFGPACPENSTPAGTSLSSVARTKFGALPYGGEGIYECVKPGNIAITYEDGPFGDYTNHILDLFASYNAKATFFVTGNNINKGQIDITPAHIASIQRAYAEGHQIGSHTWTHLDLSAIPSADRKNQMWKNEMALRNILGFFPTYMRPPYNSCTPGSGCQKDMADLGYHIAYYNVDTDDDNQNSPNLIQNSKNWFRGNITAGGALPVNSQWVVQAHDIHQQTAYNLTDYMLSTVTSLGYRIVTLGECLNDPVANWYRSGAGTPVSSTSARPDLTSVSSTVISTPSSSAGASASTSSTHIWTSISSTSISTSILSTSVSTPLSSTSVSTSPSSIMVSTSISSTRTSTEIASTRASTPILSTRVSTSTSSTGILTSTIISSTATRTSTAISVVPTKKVTTDATCGGTKGYTCQGSKFGNCCSVNGWCGSTTAYCGTGCQPGFGTCSNTRQSSSSIVNISTRTLSSAAPASTKKVTTDATCGGTKGYTCQGSIFGDCCSVSGWCGSTNAYCGTGCQPAFGSCTSTRQSSTRISTSAAPAPTKRVTTDATCGGSKGYTCQGSVFGNCCSVSGWCGSTAAYCRTGCQKDFGTCT